MTPELLSIVDNFVAAERRLQETIALIPAARWSEASPNAGWTYKDLPAHLATGDWICQHFLRGLLESGNVSEWPDADVGNAERVGALRGESVNELVAERAPHRNETISLIAQFEARHLESPIDMPWLDVQSAPFRVYLQSFSGHDINHTQEFMAIAGTQATR